MGFTAELGDTMGDGWNAGAINVFDHFHLMSAAELLDEITAPIVSSQAEAVAAASAARRASYSNTMLGGKARAIPLCLDDGEEYLFETEFHAAPSGGVHGPFSVGGREAFESNWTFCGASGMLSDYQHVRVENGGCVAITGWGGTPIGDPVPPDVVVTPTPAPTEGGGSRDIDGGEESPAGGDDGALTDLQIFAIGFGALMLAGAAAAGGTYAQNKGWFGGAAAAAGAGGAAGAAGGGAPNPDVDEFAP